MIALNRKRPMQVRPWLPDPWDIPPGNSPEKPCLHPLFEAQVRAKPDAVALVAGRQRLTYRELNLRANRVAHHLRSLGVGPEVLVGIFLERGSAMVAAILGVLKAGGAYLPLDPVYPPERLAFMLKDAQVRVLLTQSSLREALRGLAPEADPAPPIVSLDTDRRVAQASSENPVPSTDAGNLAYVIYTSGSTGQPKGVGLEHRNAVALLEWSGQLFGERELDGVFAGTSICFDPSIMDLLMPLCLGGKAILAPHSLALPELAASGEVRMIVTVPSAIRQLLRIGGIPPSVETVGLGGEPLPAQLVEQLHALPHIKRVYDLYGPTETTTCSTFALRQPGGPATIGRPIAGTQVYLLDPLLQPVPAGEAGELFIGGSGVARGYLNRPDLTAEKFIWLPLAGGGPARLYRTGDLCRTGPDGDLEFIGRLDQQVKIRGFRVEPGEIEAVLLAHPAVSEAIVVAHEEALGERRLAAYVVPRGGAEAEETETMAAAEARLVPQLRLHLRKHLPDYMLPSSFVLLDRFELTSSGKISHASLPAPRRSRAAAGDYAAPRTANEELLCHIWAHLLGLKQIGIHDDFFQLGGDSLLGVAMLAEVEKRTGRRLPVEAMLQAPSLSRLASLLDGEDGAGGADPDSPWVEIQPKGALPRLYLIHGVGGGMLWGYANLARHLGADQPVYAFKACAPERLEEFDTIEKVAAQYVRALRRFQPEGPYALGGYCYGGNVAYEMARQLAEQGQPVGLLALINSSPPNSSYDRVSWTLPYLLKFLHNLGHWAGGFLQWSPAKQLRFLRWKSGSVLRRAKRWACPPPGSRGGLEVGEQVDLSAVPSSQRCLWESHVRALGRHQPRPYDGKLVLLRTRGHPLNCSYDRQCGWGDLARGGVAVRMLPGLHESLLEEPHVRALAAELKRHLGAMPGEPGESP